jgi:hypothetical protein
MVVTIHQPEHLPWLGLLDKINQADCWIVLDDVQYRRHYFQNRNKARTATGFTWLTVPVKSECGITLIKDVEVNNSGHWRHKCRETIRHAYGRAPFFKTYAPFLESIYDRSWRNLADLNLEIIRFLLRSFGIEKQVLRSSQFGRTERASDLLLALARESGASVYLSGVSGREYLAVEKFAEAGIEVRFQDFHHPIYRQLYEPFLPCMSAVDLLFNHGPQSADILFGETSVRLEEVFL